MTPFTPPTSPPITRIVQQSICQQCQQCGVFITDYIHTQHPPYCRLLGSTAQLAQRGTFINQDEQHTRDSPNTLNDYLDSIDPQLLQALPQNQCHGTAPESPIGPANLEPQTGKILRSPKDFVYVSGFLKEKNCDGKHDCFKNCELRRYGKDGFPRRANLLVHLRSCHQQDIPRGGGQKACKKTQHRRRL